MKAGFISPSFRMLEVNWVHDFEMVKLGVPTFMGFLYRNGHRDLRHWDFDADICDAIIEDPESFDMRRYFDLEAVNGFLRGTDDSLRAQTEKIIDTLGIGEQDIYGISLSAVLDRIVNVMAIAAVGQCMSVVLKERYPNSRIVFGGLQVNPDSLHEGYYRKFMEDCPQIDYVLMGRGDEYGVQLFRNIASGREDRNHNLQRVMLRGTDHQGQPAILMGSGRDLDPDLAQVPVISFQSHHRAHTKKGALEQATSAIEAAKQLAQGAGQQVVAYEATHNADGSEISAREAGSQEWERLPSRVPYFDPALVDKFRYSGQQIMKRFKFNEEQLLRYSRFENDRIVVLPSIFVKGCNAPCGFCSYAYNKIEGEDIIDTVEGLKWLSETYNCKHFHFLNTQINSVYQYCEAFCDAITAAELNIYWSDCANMRFLDEALLEKMRKAGATRLVYGVESPEDEMLRYIHKGITVEKIERLLKVANDLGIWNHVLLIAGMPHETKGKLDRMVEFFERTANHIDFYTVSSFYLIASSPWGQNPEKFGIERVSSPDQLLEDQAFNEIADGRWESDGLTWAEKKEQIVQSTRLFYRTISRVKGQSRCVGGNIDLYLLMFLYSALGHDRKQEIVDLYVETANRINPMENSEVGTGASEPHAFQIKIPVVIGRVNEADQSSLMQMPVTIEVSPRDWNEPHFVASPRYTFSFRTPRMLEGDDRFSRQSLSALKESLPNTIGQLGQVLQPFLTALDSRMAPSNRERMAQLVALNLPRYKPFVNLGYTVVGANRARSMEDRMLQYAGLVN